MSAGAGRSMAGTNSKWVQNSRPRSEAIEACPARQSTSPVVGQWAEGSTAGSKVLHTFVNFPVQLRHENGDIATHYSAAEIGELIAATNRICAAKDTPSEMQARCRTLGLKGTVLLAAEGINLFLAGEEADVESFLCALRADARYASIEVKRSWSAAQPFKRLLVKIKRKIVTMGCPEIDPA